MQVFVCIFNGDILPVFYFLLLHLSPGRIHLLPSVHLLIFFPLFMGSGSFSVTLGLAGISYLVVFFSSVSLIFAVELFLHSQPFCYFFFDSTALIPSLLWRLPHYLEKSANAPFTFAFPRWK